MELANNFQVETWESPENIRKLTLKGKCFSNGIKFQIPVDVYELVIFSTNITSMDGIRFPTGLRVSGMHHNQNLMSMVDTNVQELTQLVDVNIRLNPVLSRIDKFNKNFRVEYRLNSGSSVSVRRDY